VNVNDLNDALLRGAVDQPGLLPHLDMIERASTVFRVDFGLEELPREPGVILIRGARQYGKSTWLEGQIRDTIRRFGPGSALYLNGDNLPRTADLDGALTSLAGMFAPDAPVRRLFIDEITSVPDWSRALKRVLDTGYLRDVLVVTTGSRATDLRRGAERLPGRKGRLDRSSYLFTPLSFAEFSRVCGGLGPSLLSAYLISGGCPVACAELADHGVLPPWVLEMIRDWILGECAASGRPRSSLRAVMQVLHRLGGSPVGQAKLAREAGLANNTVAAGYIELLADLMCVGVARAWDASRNVHIARRPAKFPLLNLLAAVAWAPLPPRSPEQFDALPADVQGRWMEWLVAQELWRRQALTGEEEPEQLAYWRSKDHELDFVEGKTRFIEVKRGAASPMEYAWFPRSHPGAELTVICRDPFQAGPVRGVTMETFLLEG
jgi:uncharacterized protein